jgi:hypothetical protein
VISLQTLKVDSVNGLHIDKAWETEQNNKGKRDKKETRKKTLAQLVPPIYGTQEIQML